jgi:hypothetical protein
MNLGASIVFVALLVLAAALGTALVVLGSQPATG